VGRGGGDGEEVRRLQKRGGEELGGRKEVRREKEEGKRE